MKITRKLNIVHTIHFSLLLSFIFIIHFFILLEVINDNLLRQARQKAVLIEKIMQQEYQYQAIHGAVYQHEKLSFKEQNDFKFLDSLQIVAPFSFFIVGNDSMLIYKYNQNKPINQDQFKNKIYAQAKSVKSIKKISLFNDENINYLAAVHHTLFPNLYLIVYHPRAKLFNSLGNYFLIISILFFIVLLLLLTMVMRTNYKYTRGISNIMENLHEHQASIFKVGGNFDETIILQRYIDTLQNQLEFYVKNLEKSKSENLKIEKDLEIARKLQSNILPKQIPEIIGRKDFSIEAVSEAAFELGGDFYDYFLLDENHLVFVIGDIAGKGIPASLYMIFTHTLLRSLVEPGCTVSAVVEKLNNRLIEESVSDLFITMIVGMLDTTNGQIEFCNAAHNYPLLIRSNGEIEELTQTHGIPLGIYANRQYNSTKIQLSQNDQLFLYTDGLVEIKDESNMYFSVDVLKYNLIGTWFMEPQQVIEKIQNDVKAFRGNVEPTDDMTMLLLKYHPRGQSSVSETN